MFGTDYKREMDTLEPSRAAMDRLEALTKGEAEVKQVRRFGRRAVVALALCAALAVSAVAAGTGIWQSISARQGPFSQIAQTIHGALCTDQGIEVQVLSALADDVRGQVYFTVRDVTGDRLDRQLTLKTTADSDIGGELVEYDPESRTALFVAHLNYYDPQIQGDVGIVTGQKQSGGVMRLALDGMTTRNGYLEASASCAGVTNQLLDSLPLSDQDRVVLHIEESGYTQAILPDRQVVLAPGQTPMAMEGTEDVTISSMGFASDGRFHVRVAYASGITHDDVSMGYFLSRIYPEDDSQSGQEKYWLPMVITQVDGGLDVMFPLIQAGEANELDEVYFYGNYTRPGIDLSGTWDISFKMTYHPSTTLAWTGELAGRQVTRVTVSPMTVTIDSNDTGGFSSDTLYAVLKDGTSVAAQPSVGQYVNVGQDVEVMCAYNTWEFEQPVEVSQIYHLNLLEQSIPVN